MIWVWRTRLDARDFLALAFWLCDCARVQAPYTLVQHIPRLTHSLREPDRAHTLTSPFCPSRAQRQAGGAAAALREVITYPFLHADAFAALGVECPKGNIQIVRESVYFCS